MHQLRQRIYRILFEFIFQYKNKLHDLMNRSKHLNKNNIAQRSIDRVVEKANCKQDRTLDGLGLGFIPSAVYLLHE